MSNTTGIDYGLGHSNVDKETGIRFGVIRLNSLANWIYDDAKSIYGDPACPECGNTVKESNDETLSDDWETDRDPDGDLAEQEWFDGKDFACLTCHVCYWSDSVYGDEPIGWNYLPNSAEYKTDYSEGLNALFVVKSPFYTYARYCSPCAPGALDLDNPLELDGDAMDDVRTGPKGYCFGHELFEDDKGAPYRVFRVADDTEVLPTC